MNLTLVRYCERPDLWERSADVSREVWPEYNLHSDVLNPNWHRLFEVFPSFQFILYDEDGLEVVAEGHSAPCPWDGTIAGLHDGIDDMLLAALEAAETGQQPTALCAMAAEIRPHFQGVGLADRLLDEMAGLGRSAGLGHLIAPVRPSLKERYPLAPIDRYVTWTREDGQPFDPWIRVHTRRGGRLVKPVPRSLHITGTVAEWEAWTGMRFPADGEFVFPRGLAPLSIDLEADLGDYWEPNVWIVHAPD